MEFKENIPPRIFKVDNEEKHKIADCAHIRLKEGEQVTFETESGTEFDVARKSWGYYATPSLNGRLINFGLRGVLVRNPFKKYYVWLVEKGREGEFLKYLKEEQHDLITWLDTDEALDNLSKRSEIPLNE